MRGHRGSRRLRASAVQKPSALASLFAPAPQAEKVAVELVRLDAIAAIRSNGAGHATVDFVDGSSRQVVIPTENRVFYLLNDSDLPERLDMGKFAAVEFLR